MNAESGNMETIAHILIIIVAALHIGFLILEMFLWKTEVVRKRFGMSAEYANASATLAANQGLYNGFLAAGLIWGLVANKPDVIVFFLICVVVAGIYGGITSKLTILWFQALPALIALGAFLSPMHMQAQTFLRYIVGSST